MSVLKYNFAGYRIHSVVYVSLCVSEFILLGFVELKFLIIIHFIKFEKFLDFSSYNILSASFSFSSLSGTFTVCMLVLVAGALQLVTLDCLLFFNHFSSFPSDSMSFMVLTSSLCILFHFYSTFNLNSSNKFLVLVIIIFSSRIFLASFLGFLSPY